jgi:rRNA pseudouridine-1189 N-methylase Emg1 (Nep1/Mra1 family)
MKTEAFIQEVAEHIVNGKLIPFIGAGLSVPKGYPSWSKLLEQVLSEAKKSSINDQQEKEINDLINVQKKPQDAANRLAALIPTNYKHYVANAINKHEEIIIRKGRKKISSAHENISKWACDTVITTNYDSLIENHYTSEGLMYDSLTHNEISQILSENGKKKIFIHRIFLARSTHL